MADTAAIVSLRNNGRHEGDSLNRSSDDLLLCVLNQAQVAIASPSTTRHVIFGHQSPPLGDGVIFRIWPQDDQVNRTTLDQRPVPRGVVAGRFFLDLYGVGLILIVSILDGV